MKISALLNDRQDPNKTKTSETDLVHVQPVPLTVSTLVSPSIQPITTTDLPLKSPSPVSWQSYPSPVSTPHIVDPLADDRWASLINEAVKLEPIPETGVKKSFPSAESTHLSTLSPSRKVPVLTKKDLASLVCPVNGW